MSQDFEIDIHEFAFYHNIFRPTVVATQLHLLQNLGTLRTIMLVAMPIEMKSGTHSSVAL